MEDRDEIPYELRPKSSSAPLTMGQIIHVIDDVVDPWADGRAGLVLAVAQEQLENGLEPDRCVGFIAVTSAHYPQLAAYFRNELHAWCDRIQRNRKRRGASSG